MVGQKSIKISEDNTQKNIFEILNDDTAELTEINNNNQN